MFVAVLPNILLFSTFNSPRLRYILHWIFKEQLQTEVQCTSDIDYWNSYNGAKINYSHQKTDTSSLHIVPHKLLNESDIQVQQLAVNRWKQSTILFYNQPGTLVPFDIFAASFYMISRYEEYLPHQKDVHGRYKPEASVASEFSFLQQPVVDEWLMHFKRILEHKFNIVFPAKTFRFVPTYDIDIAWKYLHKGTKRQWGGAFKDFIALRFSSVMERFEVISGKRKDPFDCFDWLDEIHEKYRLKPVYFILLGSKGAYDKNADPQLPAMQALMKKLLNKYEVGIHPSYLSNQRQTLLHKEIEILSKAGNKTITQSRQHYIKLSLPETYENLIAAGIKEDYSMGYASANGFRAGTSNAFYWYHLKEERTTALRVHPFVFMEATSKFYLKQNTKEAWLEWERLWHAVKNTNGTFICIWHNYTLGTDKNSNGWRELYLKGLDLTLKSSFRTESDL
jgi:hypothetical protein